MPSVQEQQSVTVHAILLRFSAIAPCGVCVCEISPTQLAACKSAKSAASYAACCFILMIAANTRAACKYVCGVLFSCLFWYIPGIYVCTHTVSPAQAAGRSDLQPAMQCCCLLTHTSACIEPGSSSLRLCMQSQQLTFASHTLAFMSALLDHFGNTTTFHGN